MIDKGLILGLLIFFPRQQFGAGMRAAVCGHSEPHRASCVLLDTFLPSSRLRMHFHLQQGHNSCCHLHTSCTDAHNTNLPQSLSRSSFSVQTSYCKRKSPGAHRGAALSPPAPPALQSSVFPPCCPAEFQKKHFCAMPGGGEDKAPSQRTGQGTISSLLSCLQVLQWLPPTNSPKKKNIGFKARVVKAVALWGTKPIRSGVF